MSETNPETSKQRFAELRKVRRRAKAAQLSDDPSSKLVEPSVALTVRTTLAESTHAKLMAALGKFELSKTVFMSRLLSWFVNQPRVVQNVVMAETRTQIAELFQQALLRNIGPGGE
jgi:hypothetical protein